MVTQCTRRGIGGEVLGGLCKSRASVANTIKSGLPVK